MSLSDTEYQDLKKDDWIAGCIAMLKDIMKDNVDERVKKQKQEKTEYIHSLNATVSHLENLIEDKLLCSLLKLNDTSLTNKLKELKDFCEIHLKSLPNKVGKNLKRNSWLHSLSVRLYDLGCTVQRRRLEFIYKLFYEYDFDGCRTAMESENTSDKDLDRFDQENMMDLFKHIDRKAINDYLGEK